MFDKKLAVIIVILLSLIALFFYPEAESSKEQTSKYTGNDLPVKAASNSSLIERRTRATEKPLENAKLKPKEESKDQDIGFLACLPEITLDEESRASEIESYFESVIDTEPLFYALYAKPIKGLTRLDLLLDNIPVVITHPVSAMKLIHTCVNDEDERCTTDLIKQAIEADTDNAAMWAHALSFFIKYESKDEVIAAINQLLEASYFNERFGEQRLLYTQALEDTPWNEFSINSIDATSHAVIPKYSSLLQFCEENSIDKELSNSCLALGERLEVEGKTLRTRYMGLAIQRMVQEKHNDYKAVEMLDERNQALHDRQRGLSSLHNNQALTIMTFLDERLNRTRLINNDTYGELVAAERMQEEAKILYEENENKLCTFIYETAKKLF